MMEAFRIATENEEELKHGIEVGAVYLIISGIPDEPKEAACSYVQESFAGKTTTLHCIYYEPTEFDVLGLGGRYADTETTVSYLKDLAHGVHGRFHWVKGEDVIESDDIRRISDEMVKVQNYRRKAEMLLEAIGKSKATKGESTEILNTMQLVPRPPSSSSKRKVGPPRQTALSQARINGIRPQSAVASRDSPPKGKSRPKSAMSPQRNSPLSVAWKPNTASSSTNLIPAVQSNKMVKESSKKHGESFVKPTQQIFYTEIGNEIGSVFRSYPVTVNQTKKPGHAASTNRIPDKEELCTTKENKKIDAAKDHGKNYTEWLRHYGLLKLKLDLNVIVNTTECSHSKGKVPTLRKSVPAKYCEIFPSVTIKGVTRHLHLQPQDLEEYEDQLEKVMKRYVKRLHWLLNGSRKVFGTLTEKNIILLIDVSGSMVTSMEELRREITGLVWEQIHQNKLKFNLIKFSSEAVPWKSNLAEPTEEACQDACSWVTDFEAYGGTCTLDALKIAFDDDEVSGIYLLTDGKPDNSTTSVLREVATQHALRKVKVHTISFNCDDSVANRFLQLLAAQTGGRYHRFQGHVDGNVYAHQISTEGFTEDDENHPFPGEIISKSLQNTSNGAEEIIPISTGTTWQMK